MDELEQNIIERAVKGDKTAFGFLVQKHYDAVFNLAFRLLKNFSYAQDITQDVFLEAFQNLRHLRDPLKFPAWLRGITFNLCKMWLRKYKEAVILGEMDDETQNYLLNIGLIRGMEDFPHVPTPAEEYESAESQDMLVEAIDSLPEGNRLVIKLYYMDDLSYREIATFLNVPVTTVESRMFRARNQLREEIMDVAREAHSHRPRPAGYAAYDSKLVIDPETGVQYRKIMSITGSRDVVEIKTGLNISPNGKFLLWGVTVVPLNGVEPFDLVDMTAYRGTWSPDGRKVVFYSGGIWLLPVSPATGRPAGAPGKLLDGDYWYQRNVSWSPDSEKIAFTRFDDESKGNIWTLSLKDASLTQVTDNPALKSSPVWSPDGGTIAYNSSGIWLIPADGGKPDKIIDAGRRVHPIHWSQDGKWLVYDQGIATVSKLWFFHLADRYQVEVKPPLEVGSFLSLSSDGSRVIFYRPSYDYLSTLRIVSASGGSSSRLGKRLKLWPYDQFWTPDSRMIITDGVADNGDLVFWAIPVSGRKPFPLKLNVSVPANPAACSMSPDCSMLLFTVKRDNNMHDLWMVPVSPEDLQVSGPPVMIFSGWVKKSSDRISWSPDGSKFAMTHKYNVWIVSTDGDEPVQITRPPGGNYYPIWSPDGKMIAYECFSSVPKGVLNVIPESGGEARTILDVPEEYRLRYVWSPDGKELTVISQDAVISAYPIDGGEPRRMTDLRYLVLDRTHGLCRSPDNRSFVFIGWNKVQGEPGRIYTVSAEGGKATVLASDDLGDKGYLYWSPDGQWISYSSDGMFKTRPEGTIWESDMEDMLKF